MASLFEKKETKFYSTTELARMRTPYLSKREVLVEEKLTKNPLKLFREWFEEACKCTQIEEPNAMCLATTTKNGFPSARYVLLKNFDANGFTFFTNYSSRKGKELEENPNAAAVFYWEPLKRSVRVEGTVCKITETECNEYFHSRPKESQIGACVSQQSSVIPGRKVLDEELHRLKKLYENKEVPRPQNWGGFQIQPHRIEFWQGQSNRLHDRILFRHVTENENLNENLTHSAEDGWVYERLSP